jgi:hypothetical protein
MNRKPVSKDVRQTKKDVSRLKSASLDEQKRDDARRKNKEKLSFVMSIDPFAKVKQEIYNKVKHHLTSSRETARLTTRTTTL